MKFGLLAASAAAALVLGSQTASAQPIIIRSGGYSPGYTSGPIVRPGGFNLGSYYNSAPRYYAPPIYAAPVLVPVRPVVPVGPYYGSSYYRSYSTPYGHNHNHNHCRRW